MLNEPSKDILGKLPRYGANNEMPPEAVVIHGHFFASPAYDWYVSEFDGKDTFFGFVNLNCPMNAEWGSFTLSELRELRLPIRININNTEELSSTSALHVEWDEYWRPKQFSEIEIPGLSKALIQIT